MDIHKLTELLPNSPGRTDKDAAQATCTVFGFNVNDINFYSSLCRSPMEKKKLQQFIYFTKNNLECRRVQLARYFGEELDGEASGCHADGQKCDNCTKAVSSTA